MPAAIRPPAGAVAVMARASRVRAARQAGDTAGTGQPTNAARATLATVSQNGAALMHKS